ncbi:hypothetical protein CBR_g49326 [Chara braunii]|uniref:Uncharacterized protein n=1 Tax=Chara braunii TaxID=69332 RepID=A0A388M4R6_CHABU|nr:hypothetical protein CBR_g49326 [Chara braunii]|eukprot:GBG89536.1 hypothetical protein CBR_g49326 [Chara braunii]
MGVVLEAMPVHKLAGASRSMIDWKRGYEVAGSGGCSRHGLPSGVLTRPSSIVPIPIDGAIREGLVELRGPVGGGGIYLEKGRGRVWPTGGLERGVAGDPGGEGTGRAESGAFQLSAGKRRAGRRDLGGGGRGSLASMQWHGCNVVSEKRRSGSLLAAATPQGRQDSGTDGSAGGWGAESWSEDESRGKWGGWGWERLLGAERGGNDDLWQSRRKEDEQRSYQEANNGRGNDSRGGGVWEGRQQQEEEEEEEVIGFPEQGANSTEYGEVGWSGAGAAKASRRTGMAPGRWRMTSARKEEEEGENFIEYRYGDVVSRGRDSGSAGRRAGMSPPSERGRISPRNVGEEDENFIEYRYGEVVSSSGGGVGMPNSATTGRSSGRGEGMSPRKAREDDESLIEYGEVVSGGRGFGGREGKEGGEMMMPQREKGVAGVSQRNDMVYMIKAKEADVVESREGGRDTGERARQRQVEVGAAAAAVMEDQRQPARDRGRYPAARSFKEFVRGNSGRWYDDADASSGGGRGLAGEEENEEEEEEEREVGGFSKGGRDGERGNLLMEVGRERPGRSTEGLGYSGQGPGAKSGGKAAMTSAEERKQREREEVRRLLIEGLGLLKEGREGLRGKIEVGIAERMLHEAEDRFAMAVDLAPSSLNAMGHLANAFLAHGELKLRVCQECRALIQGLDAQRPGEGGSGPKWARGRDREKELEKERLSTTMNDSAAESEELLIEAGRKFKTVLSQDKRDVRALHNWGLALCFRAELAAENFGKGDIQTADKLYQAGIEKFEAMLTVDPKQPNGIGASSSSGSAGSSALVIVPNAGTSTQNATVLTGVQYIGPVVDKRAATLPSKYDGKRDITSWISSMRSYFEVLQTPQEDRSMIMGTNTEPVVRSFIELQSVTTGYERIDLIEWLKVTPVRTLEDLLITQYQDKHAALKARLNLEALKGQTRRTSMQALEQHLTGLLTTPNLGLTDVSCMDVVMGVTPKEYVSQLGLKDHTTWRELLTDLVNLEAKELARRVKAPAAGRTSQHKRYGSSNQLALHEHRGAEDQSYVDDLSLADDLEPDSDVSALESDVNTEEKCNAFKKTASSKGPNRSSGKGTIAHLPKNAKIPEKPEDASTKPWEALRISQSKRIGKTIQTAHVLALSKAWACCAGLLSSAGKQAKGVEESSTLSIAREAEQSVAGPSKEPESDQQLALEARTDGESKAGAVQILYTEPWEETKEVDFHSHLEHWQQLK